MQKKQLKMQDTLDAVDNASQEPAIDYSAKVHTLRGQFIFGVKLFAAAGIFFLLIWMLEKI